MPIPQFTVIPSRDRPATFSSDGDTHLAELQAFVDGANALEQSLQLVATTGTSTTSIAIGAGSKTITTQAGKAWVAGSFVYVVSAASVANIMIGQVTSYNSTTGQLVFNVAGYSGSGTIANWIIGLSGGIAAAMTFATSVTTAALYVDSTYYLTISSAKPVISFDSTDYFSYDRSNDRLDLYIGGTSHQYWSSTDGPARSNDAATNDGLVRKLQLDNATAQATTTARGTVELATSAEVAAGTDAALVVTPATLAASKILQSASVATTSGVAVDFTGIPSWAKRVTILLKNVSTNGTSMLLLQPGSGSPQTSGYTDSVTGITYGTSGGAINSSSGFPIFMNSASSAMTGAIELLSMGGDSWIASGSLGSVASPVTGVTVSGSVALSGVLDRVRLKTENGTDAFDAGSVCILWE